MTVKELINKCYDTIIIYTNLDDDFIEFIDLFKGKKDDVPFELLEKEIHCFGAEKHNVIEISIVKE